MGAIEGGVATPGFRCEPARHQRDGIRLVLSLVPAAAINLLLLLLILRLVDPTLPVPREETIYRTVEWVSLKHETKEARETPIVVSTVAVRTEPSLPEPEPLSAPIIAPAAAPPVPRLHLDPKPDGLIIGGPYPVADLPLSPEPVIDVEPSFRVAPVYPPRARRAGIEGSVTVEFTITRDGAVSAPRIVRSDPPGVFDASVIQAIRKWKFPPRIVDGQRVDRRAKKDIVFTLETR